VSASADWNAGGWHVLFRRPLAGTLPSLKPGLQIPVGVAIWVGAADERAGLKAHTPGWHRLAIESLEVRS
jgi:hypothetical protein